MNCPDDVCQKRKLLQSRLANVVKRALNHTELLNSEFKKVYHTRNKTMLCQNKEHKYCIMS